MDLTNFINTNLTLRIF